jgi:hypothetical protein
MRLALKKKGSGSGTNYYGTGKPESKGPDPGSPEVTDPNGSGTLLLSVLPQGDWIKYLYLSCYSNSGSNGAKYQYLVLNFFHQCRN